MRASCLLILGLAITTAVPAAVITNTQGTADFANGTQLDVADYFAGNTDAAAPFDFESGLDADDGDGGSNFDVVWTHNFGLLVDPILSAALRIGLYDHESAEAGSQVNSLNLNTLFGAELTALLDAEMEALIGGGGTTVYDLDGFPVTTEYNVYSISLPAAVFSELAGGSAQFRLRLQGPGVNLFGASQYNGAFIDFAELIITTQEEPTAIPEPSTLLLIGAALPLLALFRRR